MIYRMASFSVMFSRFQGHDILQVQITRKWYGAILTLAQCCFSPIIRSVRADIPLIFMLLLKTTRPSTLTGRNVRLSKLLISSCYVELQTEKSPDNTARRHRPVLFIISHGKKKARMLHTILYVNGTLFSAYGMSRPSVCLSSVCDVVAPSRDFNFSAICY